MQARFDALKEAILRGDFSSAVALTDGALKDGDSGRSILSEGMMPAMEQLGSDFSQGKAFLPELIAGGYAMSQAAELLTARTQIGTFSEGQPTVLLGTAQGDLHDIGKNIVKIMLRGAGFEVIDLGVDVGPERFLRAAEESRAPLVGISALLSATLGVVAETVRALHERLPVKVMVGGAPVTEGFARHIRADGYAVDAYLAAKLARELVGVGGPEDTPLQQERGGRA